MSVPATEVTARLQSVDMKHFSGPDRQGRMQQGVVLDLEYLPEDGSAARSERIALSVSQLVAIANMAEVGLKELVTMGLLQHGTGWTPRRDPAPAAAPHAVSIGAAAANPALRGPGAPKG